MAQPPVALFLLAALTAYTTWRGLQSPDFFARHCFNPARVLGSREYRRLLSCAALHVDWRHYAFNFITLFLFGQYLEVGVGVLFFLGVFAASVVGGALLSLWLHRHHEYTSVGASGGVSGVVFASVIVFPDMGIGSLFIPVYIPGWIYAAAYLIGSYIAYRRSRDNVAHCAHIGGAVTGLLVAACFFPSSVVAYPVIFGGLLLLSFVILALFAGNPLGLKNALRLPFDSEPEHRSNIRYQDYGLVTRRKKDRAELDALLDKISARGFASLSDREKTRLRELSESVKS